VSAIAIPIFLYAIEVWFPSHIKYQTQLERVQKYSIRLILNNFNKDATYESLLAEVNWPPLYRRVAERRLITIYKYLNGIRYMEDCVFPYTKEDIRRQSARLKLMECKHNKQLELTSNQRNSLEEKLSASQMRNLWNALPTETVNSRLNVFRTQIQEDSVFSKLCENGAIHPLANV
jgi:hypothetical protein